MFLHTLPMIGVLSTYLNQAHVTVYVCCNVNHIPLDNVNQFNLELPRVISFDNSQINSNLLNQLTLGNS